MSLLSLEAYVSPCILSTSSLQFNWYVHLLISPTLYVVWIGFLNYSFYSTSVQFIIALIPLGEIYKMWSNSLHNCAHPPARPTYSYSDPNSLPTFRLQIRSSFRLREFHGCITKQVGVKATTWTSIWEPLGSNIGWKISYSQMLFVVFFSLSMQLRGKYFDKAKAAFVQVHSN
jgi:hypothetical protein